MRMCAIDAAGNMSTGATATAVTAETGEGPAIDEFLINNGDEASFDELLDLSFVALDPHGVDDMCFSLDPELCEDWQPYDTAAEWEVEPGFEGELTLYAWARDSLGNESEGVSAEVGEHISAWVSIPMEAGVESLNAAVAASVVAFELARQRLTQR